VTRCREPGPRPGYVDHHRVVEWSRPATSTNTQFVLPKGVAPARQYPFWGDAAHQTRGIPVPEVQEVGLPSVCQATGFWSNMSRIC
jgi:hypothetical protein